MSSYKLDSREKISQVETDQSFDTLEIDIKIIRWKFDYAVKSDEDAPSLLLWMGWKMEIPQEPR